MSGYKTKQKKIELLVLCQLFYPELVSTGQTLTELCEELAVGGVHIEVVCGPPTVMGREAKVAKHITYRGIRITHMWGTRFPKLNLLGRITNQITFAISVFLYLLFDFSKKPILVLTNPPFLAITCAVLRALRIGKRYIYLIFDVYPDTAVQLGVLKENGFISRIWNRLNTFVFKHSTALIVIGRCMRDVITAKMKTNGLNIEGKIHNIPVWSDDRLIGSALGKVNPFLEKWNLKGKFVVGYFGNMGRFHDMETIMQAAKILSKHRDIVFLFVGEGYKKRYIIDFAKQWNLDNCQFHSYVDRQDLGFSLSSASIGLVSLAKGQEGLSVPSKTFALMAAGIPIIAIMSYASEIAKIIEEENCGTLVEPGQKEQLAKSILDFYNEREKLEIMGKNASLAIDTKYNLHEAAKKYLNIILEISSQKK
jgi:glycosyltransferase involved in cell wall biosynthesis